MASTGGVVLAGGRSTRMGAAKASLPWHGSTLLRRTVGILARATGGPVVVVRARGQELPDLPRTVFVVDDPREGRGPLQGIAAGLGALVDQVDRAFVASTDLPFLHPAFVHAVVAALDGPGAPDVALPVARGYRQPLAAGYRTSLAAAADGLVARERLRPGFLFEQCAVVMLDDDALRARPELAAVDPGLESVVNINTPEEYRAACARPAPLVTVERRGVLRGPLRTRAATVGAAAAVIGVPGRGAIRVTVNGGPATSDRSEPLAVGDRVVFDPGAVTHFDR